MVLDRKKLLNALVVPTALVVLPCLLRPLVLAHWEPWFAFFIGVNYILSQPSGAYIPKGKFYENPQDGKSALWIILAIYAVGLGSVLGFIFFPTNDSTQTNALQIVGVCLATVGLSIRLIAIRKLGRMFQVTVQIVDDHELITTGIYAYMRHPSYTGAVLSFSAFPMIFGQRWLIAPTILLLIGVYLYRIHVEEKTLLDFFGNSYEAYGRKTKKLFPFIY